MTLKGEGLVGHWRFSGNANDASPSGHQAKVYGVEFRAEGPDGKPASAARFNGKDAWLEVPDHPSLRFGSGDFSAAVWIHTGVNDDMVGDILSKFDPSARRGINFGAISHAGVTSAQTNYRNVHFGIDAGRHDDGFTDCGRPGKGRMVCALAVFEGSLFAATFDTEGDLRGHVFRYEGGKRWADCGSPDEANAVFSLAVFGNQLYCATGRYKAWGSALPDSPNRKPGGHVYRYEADGQWIDCGRLAGPGRTDITDSDPFAYAEAGQELTAASCLTVYHGKLYAAGPWHRGAFEWDGEQWRHIGPSVRLMALTIHGDSLYALCNEGGEIMRYDGEGRWAGCGRPPETDQSYAAATYEGQLYVSTWPEAYVVRRDGPAGWTVTGRLGYNREVMGMNVYNGKLYAGVLPMADVHRYDGPAGWAWIGNTDSLPAPLRRAWTMCVYQGRLYVGTLPSGRVCSFGAGAMATHDHPLAPGWRHLAAVREGGRLKLYIDGKLAARSQAFSPADYDLSCNTPLKIGFGAQSPFRGRMSDLRLYRRALSPPEVRHLAAVGDQ